MTSRPLMTSARRNWLGRTPSLDTRFEWMRSGLFACDGIRRWPDNCCSSLVSRFSSSVNFIYDTIHTNKRDREWIDKDLAFRFLSLSFFSLSLFLFIFSDLFFFSFSLFSFLNYEILFLFFFYLYFYSMLFRNPPFYQLFTCVTNPIS